jgi:hypothetical protein
MSLFSQRESLFLPLHVKKLKRTYEKRLFFYIILEAVFHEIQTIFALFVF